MLLVPHRESSQLGQGDLGMFDLRIPKGWFSKSFIPYFSGRAAPVAQERFICWLSLHFSVLGPGVCAPHSHSGTPLQVALSSTTLSS